MEINGKWDEYPVQWDEETFFFRHKANKYALKKAKEWLSRNSGIKTRRIFTEAEWAEHRTALVAAWFLIILFGIGIIAGLIASI